MTKTGQIAGTPQYMSPEQARGESVDHRSDLFSLGSILYTACTGRPPFRSETAYGVLHRISESMPRPIREISPDIPDWLCQVINRLMAKQASDRFENAHEVAQILEQCLAHLQQPQQVALPSGVTDGCKHDALSRAETSQKGKRPFCAWVWSLGTTCLLFLLCFSFMQLTAPPEISGTWSGEIWKSIKLSRVATADGWFSGELIDASGRQGAIQLEWSRTKQRYEGRWKVGKEESGAITLRTDEDSLRGAISVDPHSVVDATTLRLREFEWRPVTEQPIIENNPATSQRPVGIQSPINGVIHR